MSVWGKIIGGAAGFAFGGPIGAIFGAMAGHSFDKRKRHQSQNFNEIPNQQKQNIFAIGVIILSAKLAKADGVVTNDEIYAFKEKFNISEKDMKKVASIFNEAKKSTYGFEPIAMQINSLFNNNKLVLEELLNNLFYIAEADGKVSASEITMIKNIAVIFGISQSQFEGIRESRKSSDKLNPYIVLGCSSNDDFKTIRKKYLQLSKEHHPDVLMNKGVPQEIIEESKKKMRAINSAFDQIEKMKS